MIDGFKFKSEKGFYRSPSFFRPCPSPFDIWNMNMQLVLISSSLELGPRLLKSQLENEKGKERDKHKYWNN